MTTGAGMAILGTAIWILIIYGVARMLRQREPGMSDEPLADELEIMRAEYPGRYCSIEVTSIFFSSGNRDIDWRAYTSGVGCSGKGKTFQEAMANLKIEEGKQ